MVGSDMAREVLVDKAWQLWAERGWAAVTLDGAAAEAGIGCVSVIWPRDDGVIWPHHWSLRKIE